MYAGPANTDPAPPTTAKAAPTKPKAIKPPAVKKAAAAAGGNTGSSGAAGSTADAAPQKLPKARTAYMIFTDDVRASVKGGCHQLPLGHMVLTFSFMIEANLMLAAIVS